VYRWDWVAFIAAFASLTVLRFFIPIDPVVWLLLLLVVSGVFLLLLRRVQERRR
jgi:steroid 5-alpha reductase family enzyme